jgi:hypothetical protein
MQNIKQKHKATAQNGTLPGDLQIKNSPDSWQDYITSLPCLVY